MIPFHRDVPPGQRAAARPVVSCVGTGRKLTLPLAALPLGLVAAAGVAVSSAVEQGGHADQTRLVVVAPSRARQLRAAQQQQEWAAAVGVLTDVTSVALSGDFDRIVKTNSAMAAVGTVAGSAGVTVALRPPLAQVRQQADVRMLRPQVQAGDGIAVSAVLSVRGSAEQASVSTSVADQLRLVSALAQAATDDSEQQVAVRVDRQAETAAVDARVARLHQISQCFHAQIDATERAWRLPAVDA